MRLLSALDSTQQLTADRVGSTLAVRFDPAGPSDRSYAALPLDGARKATVTLHADVLDDTRRRMLVEMPAEGPCALPLIAFADALGAAGYRPVPRGSEREPEPTVFVRGAVALDLRIVGTTDSDGCVTQLVVR